MAGCDQGPETDVVVRIVVPVHVRSAAIVGVAANEALAGLPYAHSLPTHHSFRPLSDRSCMTMWR